MMTKIVPAVIAATLLSSSAFAQISTTTMKWTDADGNLIREYTETKQYLPVTDPKIEVREGIALPDTVTLHEMPATIKIEKPEEYRYVIINDRPVVVHNGDRKVIHIWTK